MTDPIIKSPEQRAREQYEARMKLEHETQAAEQMRQMRFQHITTSLGVPPNPAGQVELDVILYHLVNRVQDIERALVKVISSLPTDGAELNAENPGPDTDSPSGDGDPL